MSLRMGLIALVLIAGTPGCSRSKDEVQPEITQRIPLAAWFQYSGWDGPETTRTPRLVIYSDGSLVMRRNDYYNCRPELSPYWQGKLADSEMAELAARQATVLRDPDYRTYYELSVPTDRSSTVLYFGTDTEGTATMAYGLWADDSARLDPSIATEVLPQSMLSYYVFLTELLRASREWKPWQPDSSVAWLRPFDRDRALPWPSAWPGWKEARMSRRGNSAEFVVPTAPREEFWSAITGDENGTVMLDGREWMLSWYPYFPGSERWRPVIDRDIDVDEWWPQFEPERLHNVRTAPPKPVVAPSPSRPQPSISPISPIALPLPPRPPTI